MLPEKFVLVRDGEVLSEHTHRDALAVEAFERKLVVYARGRQFFTDGVCIISRNEYDRLVAANVQTAVEPFFTKGDLLEGDVFFLNSIASDLSTTHNTLMCMLPRANQ